MSNGIIGHVPVWEDVIQWPNKKRLGIDWDVQLIGGVPYVGADVPTGETWIFRTPLHGGTGTQNMRVYKITGGVFATDRYGMQIKLCKKLNYTNFNNPYCPNNSYWKATTAVNASDVPTTAAYHPGYFLEDVFHSDCVGGDKCAKKGGTGGDGKPCIRDGGGITVGTWGNACVPAGHSSACTDNLGGTPLEYMTSWSKCYIDLQDNKYKFSPIKCRDNGCIGLTQSIVDYYTSPNMFLCGSEQCADDASLYPDLQAVSLDCKRGYNWGILNSGTMWISKDCSGEFQNTSGRITTCDREVCTKAAEYCDYTPKVYGISTSIMSDPKYEPVQECSGDIPKCVTPDGTLKNATCIGTSYMCDPGECNTAYRPSEDHVCINGIWTIPSDSSWILWMLIILVIITTAIAISRVYSANNSHTSSYA